MEIMQSMTALMQIATYYQVQEELEQSIYDTLHKMKVQNLIE